MKNRPVVVGIGDIQQKDQFDNLDEALILMEKASIKAIKDCENSEITKYIDEVQIPKGFWKYRDPGKWIAEKNNFPNVTTTVSKIGILQQSLINDACKKIIDGKIKACLIVGGEARYKRIKAQIENKNFIETELNENPDFYVKPSDDLNINIEIENLGTMAVGYYAILESAFRCSKNRDFHDHHRNIANVYSKFSKIAKVNKMGWLKESFTSEDILNSSKRNPQMAFPYNKLHCTSWNVNQAAAMILCSEELADKLNINAKKRIYPLASSENNHMIPTLLRQNLFESYGLNLAAKFILDVCKKNNLKPTYYDLYSCFPAAVQMFAEALRIKNISSTSLTGGMSFAGGPLNSYVINSTVQLFKKIRENKKNIGIITGVSGMMTKQSFALWSGEPNCQYEFKDVSLKASKKEIAKELSNKKDGNGKIIGYTVLNDKNSTKKAVIYVEDISGKRNIIRSYDNEVINKMENNEWVGRNITYKDLQLAT